MYSVYHVSYSVTFTDTVQQYKYTADRGIKVSMYRCISYQTMRPSVKVEGRLKKEEERGKEGKRERGRRTLKINTKHDWWLVVVVHSCRLGVGQRTDAPMRPDEADRLPSSLLASSLLASSLLASSLLASSLFPLHFSLFLLPTSHLSVTPRAGGLQ